MVMVHLFVRDEDEGVGRRIGAPALNDNVAALVKMHRQN